jgi:hypothetical protein
VTTHGASRPDRALPGQVHVEVQGDIPYDAHRWATQALWRAVRRDAWPLRAARVRLTRPPHLVAVCRADIQADLGGRLFHVRAEARDARTALGIAVERLSRQVAAVHAGEAAGARRPRAGGPGADPSRRRP